MYYMPGAVPKGVDEMMKKRSIFPILMKIVQKKYHRSMEKKVTGQPLHKQWMISKLLNTEGKEGKIKKKINGEQVRASKGLAVGRTGS